MIERENERVSLRQTVELDSSSGKHEVHVSDLSTGGCYVDTISQALPDEEVGLTFVLPHGRTEQIFGTVVYVHEGIGFGVRFNDLTPEKKMVLEQLILLNGGKL
jgi:hypothetical protein